MWLILFAESTFPSRRFGLGPSCQAGRSGIVAQLRHLARKGAVLVLAELARRGSLLMKEFVTASELHFDAARRLRVDLEMLGLIQVEEKEVSGARTEMTIRLTRVGQGVGDYLVAVDELLRSSKAPSGARSRREEP